MAYKFELAKRAHSYLRRLIRDYRANKVERLADVLEGSLFAIREETSFDNWNGGTYGHDVVLYVPDELIGFVPLDQQGELQEKIKTDLNRAATAIENEFFEGVHFEYLDDPSSVPSNAVAIASDRRLLQSEVGSSLWKPSTIRLFISHRDADKKVAHDLASALEKFAVSSFVAHDAIEPDEDWQREIERGLQSMDAMLALITDTFFSSPWTNQEIGFALGRNVPVISLKVGTVDPAGFIRNRQAIKGTGLSVAANARAIIEVIAKRIPESPHMRRAVIDHFVKSPSFIDAAERFEFLSQLKTLTDQEVETVVQGHNDNNQIHHCFLLTRNGRLLDFINERSTRKFVAVGSTIVEEEHPF